MHGNFIAKVNYTFKLHFEMLQVYVTEIQFYKCCGEAKDKHYELCNVLYISYYVSCTKK